MPKEQKEKNKNNVKSLFSIIDSFYFKRNGNHLSENVRKKMFIVHSKIRKKEERHQEEEHENVTAVDLPVTSTDKTQLTILSGHEDEQVETDESNKKDDKGCSEDEEEFDLSTPSVKLPLKLLFVLDSRKYEHILDWSANGKEILVTDTEIFSNVVLPALFEKDAKFESFTRKMRRWGFSTKKGRMVPSSESSKKPNKNRTKYLFKHNEFQRNQPELCANISCSNTSRTAALKNFDQVSNRTNSFQQQQNLQVGIAPSNFIQLNNATSFANSSLAQQNLSTPATPAFMPFQQQRSISDILNTSQNASMFLSNISPSLPQFQEQQTAAFSGDGAPSLFLLRQQQRQNEHNVAITLQNSGIPQQPHQGILDYGPLLSQANQNLTTIGTTNLNLFKDEWHSGSQLSSRVPNSNMMAMNLLQSFPNIGVNNSTSADLHRILPVSSNPYAQEPSNFFWTANGLRGDFWSRPEDSTISLFGISNYHNHVNLDTTSRWSQIQTPIGQSQVQHNHYSTLLPRQEQHQQQLLANEESSLRNNRTTRNKVVVQVEEEQEGTDKRS